MKGERLTVNGELQSENSMKFNVFPRLCSVYSPPLKEGVDGVQVSLPFSSALSDQVGELTNSVPTGQPRSSTPNPSFKGGEYRTQRQTNTKHQIPNTEHQTPNTKHRTPNTLTP